MSSSKRRRLVRLTRKGRPIDAGPFVMLEGYVLKCPAYLSMKAIPKTAYTELRRRFNGLNNGLIMCSCRQMAEAINCSKDSALAALKELEAKGFIKCEERGNFHYKVRHAPTWILTEEEYAGKPPTKEFMRWHLSKEKADPKSETVGPQKATQRASNGSEVPATVPQQGPTAEKKHGSRS